MKNFIKTFRIEFAAGIVLLALVIFALNKPEQKPESVRTIRQLVVDSTKTVEAKAIISKKDSVIKVLWARIITTKSGLAKMKEVNKGLKLSNDTLLSVYRRSGSIGACDSVVDKQQEVIAGLETENDSLTNEAISYSNLVTEMADKYTVAESLLVTKQNTIDLQQSEINRLCCARNWGLKHRFWKWVFKWKCD